MKTALGHARFLLSVASIAALAFQSADIFKLAISGLISITITDWIFSLSNKGLRIHMANLITDEQKLSFAFVPKTAAGNLAKVDGAPAWSVSAPDILDLFVSEDGLTALVSAKGPVGDCQVLAEADADLGEGTRKLLATADVTVVAAEAVSVGLVAGTPELK